MTDETDDHQQRAESPAFDECIDMLGSTDSLTYEEGYHWLLGYLNDHLDELIEQMLEESDPDRRSRFVELLGHSGNPKVIPILESELKSSHAEVRSWAYSSLLHLEQSGAARIAEKFRKENPDEEFL